MKRTVDMSEILRMPFNDLCVNCGAKIERETIVQWHGIVCGFQCAYCGTWYARRGGVVETFRVIAEAPLQELPPFARLSYFEREQVLLGYYET